MSSFKDYYSILGIAFSASEADIKTAYRKMARLFHPDMHPEDTESYTSKFQEITEAYETLFDIAKKEIYDQQYQYHVSGQIPEYEQYYYEPEFEYQAPVPPKRKSYVPYGAILIFLIFFVRMFSNISPTITEAKYKPDVILSPEIQQLVDSLNKHADTSDVATSPGSTSVFNQY